MIHVEMRDYGNVVVVTKSVGWGSQRLRMAARFVVRRRHRGHMLAPLLGAAIVRLLRTRPRRRLYRRR
jgi:hypothetical protein